MMFVQIFASSACTGVVCSMRVPNTSNSSATTSPDRSPTPPTIVGSEAISSKNLPAAIRSGTVGDEDLAAHLEAPVLGQVARHELGRPRRDRRAQRERVAFSKVRQQQVEHAADVAQVDLDVGERRGAERDDDVPGGGRVADRLAPRHLDAVEDLLRAHLVERHPAVADGGEQVGVLVDADDAQPAVGEGKRQAVRRDHSR
jgi:hypothetical protein